MSDNDIEGAKRLAISHAVLNGYGIDNAAARILLGDMAHIMGAIDDLLDLCENSERLGIHKIRTHTIKDIIERHAIRAKGSREEVEEDV